MCKANKYINIQTGEELDLERVKSLKDKSLLKKNPEKWINWDFDKNTEIGLDIWNITYKSNKRAWLICDKGHGICHQICNKTLCPYCTNKKVLKGFNDVWTTNPELAKLLANPEDGYNYTQGSAVKVNWKCPDCSTVITNKAITHIKNDRLRCPLCGKGKSFPEKVLYNVLKHRSLYFYNDNAFPWSNGKRYDYYIPSLNTIIEIHGGQHYGLTFETLGGRTVQEERENDSYKYELAIKNGIDKYIVIDAKERDFDYIKNNIIKSELYNILNLENVQWDEIYKDSVSSILIKVCNEWNNGALSISELADKYTISQKTVTTYLTKGTALDLCYYSHLIQKEKRIEKNKKKVVQIKNGVCVKVWSSIKEASEYHNVTIANIIACCKGRVSSSAGYQWAYENDYIDNKIPSRKNKKNKKVAQYDIKGNFIMNWESIREASDHLGFYKDRSTISSCCRGRLKTAFGYKWEYIEY